MSEAIDISTSQRKTLLALLRRFIPGVEVWAYGSRAKWTARPNSDLDLVAFTSPEQNEKISSLKEALAESDLPFLVDLHVWSEVPERFHEIIRKEYVVIQEESRNPLPDEWRTLPLEDCMAAIIDYRGKTPTKTTFGVPLVTAKIVKGGRIEPAEEFIAESDYESWMRRGIPEKGDVVMTTEAPLGEVAQLDGQRVALAQRVITLRGKPDLLNNGYLRYLLQSTPVQDELKARATGTTVLGIKQSELRKVSLTLPSIPEQKSIAHILGTLDEKIELNRRMNVTLESTATAIYQSWFVDFEPVKRNSDGGVARPEDSLFPDSFEDSLNGEIPRGWTLTNLGKVIAIYDSKRIPLSNRQRELRQGPYPYHGAAAVMDHVDDFLFDGIYLLMGEDGSVIKADGTPILQYVWGKFWVNNHAHVLRGTNGLCTEHLMLHLKGLNIAHFVTGAVQPKLNQGNLKQIEIVLPPPAVCDAFSKAVESLFAHIRFNVEASRSLIALRDILLPKLMSGELNVGSVQLTETCQK